MIRFSRCRAGSGRRAAWSLGAERGYLRKDVTPAEAGRRLVDLQLSRDLRAPRPAVRLVHAAVRRVRRRLYDHRAPPRVAVSRPRSVIGDGARLGHLAVRPAPASARLPPRPATPAPGHSRARPPPRPATPAPSHRRARPRPRVATPASGAHGAATSPVTGRCPTAPTGRVAPDRTGYSHRPGLRRV